MLGLRDLGAGRGFLDAKKVGFLIDHKRSTKNKYLQVKSQITKTRARVKHVSAEVVTDMWPVWVGELDPSHPHYTYALLAKFMFLTAGWQFLFSQDPDVS